jgi:hypothetical protein
VWTGTAPLDGRRPGCSSSPAYVGLSYFLGEEVANRIGNIGTKAVLAVVALVVVGLLIRTGVSMWRANRHNRLAEQDAR